MNTERNRSKVLAQFLRAAIAIIRRRDATSGRQPIREYGNALAAIDQVAEELERNFVRDIDGFGEHDPRLVYYEVADAKRIVKALDQPYAGIAAFALGFCAEWCAIDALLVGDLTLGADPVTARVRGTKKSWRNRVVPLVPELAWVLKYIKPLLVGKFQTALVFDAVPEWRAIDILRAAAAALKITAIGEDVFGAHSIHDWRQTHAVALLRAGYDEQIVANHLGHKNTTLVRENYGRFIPTKHDYARAATRAADLTNSITSAKTPRSARGGKR